MLNIEFTAISNIVTITELIIEIPDPPLKGTIILYETDVRAGIIGMLRFNCDSELGATGRFLEN